MLTYLKYAAFVRSVPPAPNFFGVRVFGISRRLGIYPNAESQPYLCWQKISHKNERNTRVIRRDDDGLSRFFLQPIVLLILPALDMSIPKRKKNWWQEYRSAGAELY
jgi:hypothetical protein